MPCVSTARLDLRWWKRWLGFTSAWIHQTPCCCESHCEKSQPFFVCEPIHTTCVTIQQSMPAIGTDTSIWVTAGQSVGLGMRSVCACTCSSSLYTMRPTVAGTFGATVGVAFILGKQLKQVRCHLRNTQRRLADTRRCPGIARAIVPRPSTATTCCTSHPTHRQAPPRRRHRPCAATSNTPHHRPGHLTHPMHAPRC